MEKMSEKKLFMPILCSKSMNNIVTLPALSQHPHFIISSSNTYDKKQRHTVITGLLAMFSMVSYPCGCSNIL